MPRTLAREMKELVAAADKSKYELKRNPLSKTGFVGVIEVKGKFQARLQVPGDGRGGSMKRRQYSLPGLFDTAEDAALYLARMEESMKESNDGRLIVPPKFNKEHKPRAKPKPAAAPPLAVPESLQSPMATAMAMPTAMYMPQLPFAYVSPLPMQPFGYFPPRY